MNDREDSKIIQVVEQDVGPVVLAAARVSRWIMEKAESLGGPIDGEAFQIAVPPELIDTLYEAVHQSPRPGVIGDLVMALSRAAEIAEVPDGDEDAIFGPILDRAVAAHRKQLNVFAPAENPDIMYREQEQQAMRVAIAAVIEGLLEVRGDLVHEE